MGTNDREVEIEAEREAGAVAVEIVETEVVETGSGAELRRRRTYMLSLLWSPKSISTGQDVVGFGADRKKAARLDSSNWLAGYSWADARSGAAIRPKFLLAACSLSDDALSDGPTGGSCPREPWRVAKSLKSNV